MNAFLWFTYFKRWSNHSVLLKRATAKNNYINPPLQLTSSFFLMKESIRNHCLATTSLVISIKLTCFVMWIPFFLSKLETFISFNMRHNCTSFFRSTCAEFYDVKKIKALLISELFSNRCILELCIIYVRKFVHILNSISLIPKSKKLWKHFFHNLFSSKIWPSLTQHYL